MLKDGAIYTANRRVKTFADLMRGAVGLVDLAEREPKGSYFTLMSGLLLTAFTFEAYLNHLGILIGTWNKGDRIRVGDKYDMLCDQLTVVIDLVEREADIVRFEVGEYVVHHEGAPV